MTWFGNSFSNLKDQITTLTKEVLAEADEERESKFLPYSFTCRSISKSYYLDALSRRKSLTYFANVSLRSNIFCQQGKFLSLQTPKVILLDDVPLRKNFSFFRSLNCAFIFQDRDSFQSRSLIGW